VNVTEVVRKPNCFFLFTKRRIARSVFVETGTSRSLEPLPVTRLRRENRLLQQEREILKKAAAWFAKETL